MLKLITPLAIGLLTVISIAPKSEAFPINLNSVSFGIPGGDSHDRVVIKLGGQPESTRRGQNRTRRELASQRDRHDYSQPDRDRFEWDGYRHDR